MRVNRVLVSLFGGGLGVELGALVIPLLWCKFLHSIGHFENMRLAQGAKWGVAFE